MLQSNGKPVNDLPRGLGLFEVFCIATGAMISSGLFILPGMAFARSGPAVILAYIIAGLFCIPTVLSMSELTTAMPRAGGDYFYIMRGFGPLLGTIAGFSAWFSLSLKGSFALVGMGAYLSILTTLPLSTTALVCCIVFVLINLTGVKEAARFQVGLVAGLIAILGVYVFFGLSSGKQGRLTPFFSEGMGSVLHTASFVFVSYAGLIKVAALAEEVRKPGTTIPLGMFVSLLVTVLIYCIVIVITIVILPAESLADSLTPISDGAAAMGHPILSIIVGISAFLAFISTANSAIMTASRYPLGMSRDKLLPGFFNVISRRFNTPYISILATGVFMILVIVLLKVDLLVKVASSILILLYLFTNLTLILFRESKLLSYRPKFRSPFYPYVQILGIIAAVFLLIEMGTFIVFLMMVFIFIAYGWYRIYASKQTTRDSALLFLLERLVVRDSELRSDYLLSELKEIVIQRDKISPDKFHELIENAFFLEIDSRMGAKRFYKKISNYLGKKLDIDPKRLLEKFMEPNKIACALIRPGWAIPHIFIEEEGILQVLLVRAREGVEFEQDETASIIFVIVGSHSERQYHLEILAEISRDPEFDKKWRQAANERDLKNLILLTERDRKEK